MDKKQRPVVFFDRDGVINRKPRKHDYIKSWSEFEFLYGIEDSIKLCNQRGYLVVVVSNQRGIARGLMTRNTVDLINRKMVELLYELGGVIDAVYICPHGRKDKCMCRKPRPGMLLRSKKDFDIDLKGSVMVGDSVSDLEAGKRAGCSSLILVKNGRQLYQDLWRIL